MSNTLNYKLYYTVHYEQCFEDDITSCSRHISSIEIFFITVLQIDLFEHLNICKCVEILIVLHRDTV